MELNGKIIESKFVNNDLNIKVKETDKGQVWSFRHVKKATPISVTINKNGQIVYKFQGELESDDSNEFKEFELQIDPKTNHKYKDDISNSLLVGYKINIVR